MFEKTVYADKLMADYYEGKGEQESITHVEWCGVDIEVRRRISFEEVTELVQYAVLGCFRDDGQYCPEVKQYIINGLILEYFTNIVGAEEREVIEYANFVFNSGIMDVVVPCIDPYQYELILDAVERRVRNQLSTDKKEYNRRMAELDRAIENITENFERMFANVSPDDITNLVSALSQGGVDEEKLMAAYLKGMGENK